MTIHDVHQWVRRLQDKTGVNERHIFYLLGNTWNNLPESERKKTNIYFWMCLRCEDVWLDRLSLEDFDG